MMTNKEKIDAEIAAQRAAMDPEDPDAPERPKHVVENFAAPKKKTVLEKKKDFLENNVRAML